MKTAIYIEDGVVQLVITPETSFEKNALSSFEDKPLDAKIFAGTFYDCRGGWIRQSDYHDGGPYSYGRKDNDNSLILRIDTKPHPQEIVAPQEEKAPE